MLTNVSIYSLIIIFLISAGIVWIVGVKITQITDVIDCKFKVGEAFGGLILLSIVTNLPEISIVISGSLTHNLGIVTGNILGGIALQTVVLVLLDGFGLRSQGVLTCKPYSLQIVLAGLLVIFILLITILGAQFSKNLVFYRIAPSDVTIVISWLIGLWLIRKSGKYLPWRKRFKERHFKKTNEKFKQFNTNFIILLFLVFAIAILISGLALELTSTEIAKRMGWSNVIFGATILAFVTALPEITTGLAAIKLNDYTMAITDIFGGNAFLPTLFMVATILSGTPVLSQIQNVDIYLAGLGGLLTIIYVYGLIFSSKKQFFWLGIDSIVVLVVYLLGVVGLFFIKANS